MFNDYPRYISDALYANFITQLYLIIELIPISYWEYNTVNKNKCKKN